MTNSANAGSNAARHDGAQAKTEPSIHFRCFTKLCYSERKFALPERCWSRHRGERPCEVLWIA